MNLFVNSDINPNADDLIVKSITGGSVIDKRPLFSNDGEILYLVCKNTIKAFNTWTGDFVREFEPSDYRIVDILLHPENVHAIIGCTEKGQLDFWSCHNYIITKNLPLELPNQKAKIKTFHIVKYKTPQGNEICQALITHISECKNKIYIYLFNIENGICAKSIYIYTKSQEYYVDIIGNFDENLVALLHDTNLHILNPARNLVDKLHKTGRTGRLPTCIAGHPVDECVATGDSTGRVLVWRNLFQTRPCKTVFHWHTLPVIEIAFSHSGSHLYTGGGECVLVKWILANPQRKSYLPRLPAPIKHLTIAPDNLYVAVSTLDNGILIVSPERKVTSVIQNFTWGLASSSKDMFPAGLVVDPRTNSLVLNSRTGYVQFYNTHAKKLLYNIDITAENFLSHERNTVIVNTEVTKITLNYDGTWMATVEERHDDRISYVEVRLKFWRFDLNEQIFMLNTSFEWPHDNGVNALQFQPNTNTFGDEEWLAVTTGKDDNIFKLWNLKQSSTIQDESKLWQLYQAGDYRQLTTTDAGFAIDGSLLAVGFDYVLTIWIPETCEFKNALSHFLYRGPITRVEFGKHEACHLVVVASREYILVWNILTLRLTWSVSLNVVHLTYDPKSTYMAAFTDDNSLYVFTPQSSTLVYKKTCLIESTSSILGATFLPHLKEVYNFSFGKWQEKSQLYFLDSNQELLTLESASEKSIPLEILLDKATTSLSDLCGFTSSYSSSTDEQDIATDHEHLDAHSKFIKAMLSVPAHTLPPLKELYLPFMLTLMNRKPKTQPQNTEDSKVNDNKGRDHASESNDNNVLRPTKLAVTPTIDPDDDDEGMEFEDHDWSTLADVIPNHDNPNNKSCKLCVAGSLQHK